MNRQQIISNWILQRRPGTPLFPVTIAHELKAEHVSPGDVASVLVDLAQAGRVRRVFAVRDPYGSVLNQTFGRLDDIAPVLRGRFAREFSRDDAEILPAFELVQNG